MMKSNLCKREEVVISHTNEDRENIIVSIEKVKEALETVYTNFDYVTEPELVDSYIYELKSIQLKYKYLLQKAKELGIIVTSF